MWATWWSATAKARAGAGIEQLAAALGVTAEQPGLAQRAVDVDRAWRPRDAVLGEDHDAAPRLGSVDELAGTASSWREVLGGGWARRAEALQVVVEVRQVDQRQGRVDAGLTCWRRRRSNGVEAMSSPGPRTVNRGRAELVARARHAAPAGRV